MTSTTSSEADSGALDTCALNTRISFQPVPRWSLLSSLETCRGTLGLNSGDLVALRAMLSFLPLKNRGGEEISATHDMILICYASNSSICARANGMDESTLRRHIRRLAAKELLVRNDSATGKRFPLKQDGKIVIAYGIDLEPAFRRAGELSELARGVRADRGDRKRLRTETLALRKCLMDKDESEESRRYLTGLTNILRRASTTVEMIEQIRDHLLLMLRSIEGDPRMDELPTGQEASKEMDEARCPSQKTIEVEPQSPENKNIPASDVQNARQVESHNLKYIKKENPRRRFHQKTQNKRTKKNLPNLSKLLPNGCSTYQGYIECLDDILVSLGITSVRVLDLAQRVGLSKVLEVIDRMIDRIEQIKNPLAYLEHVIVSEMRSGDMFPCNHTPIGLPGNLVI